MQLSKKELAETQVIVTTPEKWDVITRKGGDVAVAQAVKLLIIDEVHLLNDERGPVIETLIARTQRQVRPPAAPSISFPCMVSESSRLLAPCSCCSMRKLPCPMHPHCPNAAFDAYDLLACLLHAI